MRSNMHARRIAACHSSVTLCLPILKSKFFEGVNDVREKKLLTILLIFNKLL